MSNWHQISECKWNRGDFHSCFCCGFKLARGLSQPLRVVQVCLWAGCLYWEKEVMAGALHAFILAEGTSAESGCCSG